jgi:hypothetical protein
MIEVPRAASRRRRLSGGPLAAAGVVLCYLLLWSAPASAQTAADVSWGSVEWRNPLVAGHAPAPRLAQSDAPTIACSSYEALVAALRQQTSSRSTTVTVALAYGFAFGQVEDILAMAVDQVLDADDYLKFTFGGYGAGWEGVDGEVTLDLWLTYLTDADQEAYVDARVTALHDLLITPEMNAEQRELAAHDWIVRNVQYDREGITGDLRYTAFGGLSEGLVVCQGYALLTYRLLQAAGMEVRIVPGLGGGEDHAWNLVRVCGNWYHLDVTWDDPVTDPPDAEKIGHGYFNRSDAQLAADHTWDTAAYPGADRTYVSGECAGQVQSLGWTVDRAAALAEAAAAGKQVLAVAGQPAGASTAYVLNTVLQWYYPRVRPLVAADFVVWLCDVDASDQWQPLAAGLAAFGLPLICVLDPASPDLARARLAGTSSPVEFLDWLRPWAPSASTAVQAASWGRIKHAGLARVH